jgi:hypothetical protein
MTEDEKIVAEKAKAETEGTVERKFTQADMDLAMAKVRRDEKRKADAKIAEADKLAAEVKGLREGMPTAEKIQSLIEIAIKNQAAQAQAEAEKAKAAGGGGAEGADKGKDKGEQKTLIETVAQISLKDLSPEVQGLLDGERKARERLERELADQKKASAEAKRLQEEALKSEQKRIAIENLTGALCEAKPGLPKTAAKLLARTMIEDGQVKIDGGRARYVITDPDAEFEEDRVKEISISDGAKRWAGTAESDELVPAPVSGPGVLRDNMGGRSRNSQVKTEDMSPAEQMSAAFNADFNKKR